MRLAFSARITALVVTAVLATGTDPAVPSGRQAGAAEPARQAGIAGTTLPRQATGPAEEPVTFQIMAGAVQGDAPRMWALAYSPDGKVLATVSGDGVAPNGERLDQLPPGELKLWDTATHKEIATLQEPLGVRSVAFSPD